MLHPKLHPVPGRIPIWSILHQYNALGDKTSVLWEAKEKDNIEFSPQFLVSDDRLGCAITHFTSIAIGSRLGSEETDRATAWAVVIFNLPVPQLEVDAGAKKRRMGVGSSGRSGATSY